MSQEGLLVLPIVFFAFYFLAAIILNKSCGRNKERAKELNGWMTYGVFWPTLRHKNVESTIEQESVKPLLIKIVTGFVALTSVYLFVGNFALRPTYPLIINNLTDLLFFIGVITHVLSAIFLLLDKGWARYVYLVSSSCILTALFWYGSVQALYFTTFYFFTIAWVLFRSKSANYYLKTDK